MIKGQGFTTHQACSIKIHSSAPVRATCDYLWSCLHSYRLSSYQKQLNCFSPVSSLFTVFSPDTSYVLPNISCLSTALGICNWTNWNYYRFFFIQIDEETVKQESETIAWGNKNMMLSNKHIQFSGNFPYIQDDCTFQVMFLSSSNMKSWNIEDSKSRSCELSNKIHILSRKIPNHIQLWQWGKIPPHISLLWMKESTTTCHFVLKFFSLHSWFAFQLIFITSFCEKLEA